MLYIVEDEKTISEFFSSFFDGLYDFEFISFKDLQLQIETIVQKKSEIVVDISRNPNYLLIINRLKKLLDGLSQVNFIVNSEQFKTLSTGIVQSENMVVVRTVTDLQSFFSTKLNNFRRQL